MAIATSAVALPALAHVTLKRIGAMERFKFPMRKMIAMAFIGAAIPAIAVLLSSAILLKSEVIMIIVLGSILGLGAWVDRQAAYAPDGIMVPFCLLIAFVCPMPFDVAGLEQDVLARFGIAIGLYAAGIISWMPQEITGLRIIPPADVMALIAPALIFGVSTVLAFVYLTTSIILLLALKSEKVAAIFSRKEAVDDGSFDVGLKSGHSVTFLSVIFPVFLMAISLQISA